MFFWGEKEEKMRCLNTPLLSSLRAPPHTWDVHFISECSKWKKVILIFPVSFWLPLPYLPHTAPHSTDGRCAQPSTRKGQFGGEAHCLRRVWIVLISDTALVPVFDICDSQLAEIILLWAQKKLDFKKFACLGVQGSRVGSLRTLRCLSLLLALWSLQSQAERCSCHWFPMNGPQQGSS